MTTLQCRVVGTSPNDKKEDILAESTFDRYEVEMLDNIIVNTMNTAIDRIQSENNGILSDWQPEVSILLSVEGEIVRPSLHLSSSTIALLTENGASFDFDPYV